MNIRRIGIVAAGLAVLSAPSAWGQAVAFVPNVVPFPNGVTMSATPVVSFDRRYVRLGMMPQFTALEGLDPFLVPAAVSGGPGGGGAGGGGVGAGLGGVVGFAGMNGPMAGPGMGGASLTGNPRGSGTGQPGESASGVSTDFEDQPWPRGAPSRGAPARPVAKTKRSRSTPKVEAARPPVTNRGPIQVKRIR